MNERIKLLAVDARLLTGWPVGEVEYQKFAELIVKECVSILEKPMYAMTHPEELSEYNKGWVNGRLLGIEHIKEYFGVEE